MAGGVQPQRAVLLPALQRARGAAGAATLVAGAARPVIFVRRASEIGAEAEAFVGQRDGAIRVAFTRGDGIA